MKILRNLAALSLVVTLSLSAFTGCSSKAKGTDATQTPSPSPSSSQTAFNYSEGIADNGFFQDIKALDYVELCKYTGISVPSTVHAISDDAVQTEINSVLDSYASENQIKDRAVKDGDTVNIDYVGSVNGVEFEGGSTGGSGTDVTIGVTSYIDDFLQQLIGHKPGESFDVNVTFPKEYGKEELNGKDAVFAVTINYIAEKVAPSLTDDFVSKNLTSSYGWKTVDEMKAGIRGDLQSAAVLEYIQKYVVDNSTVKSVPENLMKYQEKSLVTFYQSYADSYKMDLLEFLKTNEGVATTDELINKYKDVNKKNAEFDLVVQAIAEKSSLSITEDDVKKYFTKNTGSEDYSKYKEFYGMPYLKLNVLKQVVLDDLKNKAVME